jgi:hypothetical protein
MTRKAAEPLYLTDAEIAARVGMSAEEWLAASKALRGLPPADPVFKHRRYWPAVRAFLDRRNGIDHPAAPGVVDGEENWDDDLARRRVTRAR